jgi:hypothetical protein
MFVAPPPSTGRKLKIPALQLKSPIMLGLFLRTAVTSLAGFSVAKLFEALGKKPAVAYVLHVEGGRITRTEGAVLQSIVRQCNTVLAKTRVRQGQISEVQADGKRRLEFRGNFPAPVKQRLRATLLG